MSDDLVCLADGAKSKKDGPVIRKDMSLEEKDPKEINRIHREQNGGNTKGTTESAKGQMEESVSIWANGHSLIFPAFSPENEIPGLREVFSV